MSDFVFIRMIFFTFFFITITLTLLMIELVSKVLSKLKFYLKERKERFLEWAFMAK